MRPRVSPDGKSVAFGREHALWVRGLDPKAEPRKVVDLGAFSGEPAAWAPDGKQIIIIASRKEKSEWVFTTIRVNTDGTGRQEPAIPPEDGVQDWSADGRWLLTASRRGSKLGWVLYVMRPDGTDQRRITDGGNPFYARFSPDGRRVVFFDNGRDERSGIWVVDVDGKNNRLVLPVTTEPKANAPRIGSACWSPDGQRIAVLLSTLEENQTKVAGAVQILVVLVMDLAGGHRSEILHISDGGGNDMPEMGDWR